MALTKNKKPKLLTKFQNEMFPKPRHPRKETEKFLIYCHMEEAQVGVTWVKPQREVGKGGTPWMQSQQAGCAKSQDFSRPLVSLEGSRIHFGDSFFFFNLTSLTFKITPEFERKDEPRVESRHQNESRDNGQEPIPSPLRLGAAVAL